jgi:hypothetical protein
MNADAISEVLSCVELRHKKEDYLLTLVDFLWYILDNGSGGTNKKNATTPIIRLYLIKW